MRFTLRFSMCIGHFCLAGISLFPISASAQETRRPAAGGILDALPLLKDYEARRASSSNDDLAKNGDARPIEPGATLVLGDLVGPGFITHFWNTCNARDPFYSRSLVLRIYWDGAQEPSVEVPLGDFFGVGHAAEEAFQSLPVVNTAHGRSRNCFWKMPFRKHAKVTVTNESPKHKVDSFYYQLDWEKHESIPDQAAYFHARYRQESPAKPGDYTVLDTLGRGHFVGMVYSVHSVKNGWFGEGDDRFFIDGETLPSLRGTGTEDYFGDAWGLHSEASPFLGVTLWDGYVAGDRATAYRWHLTDPVPFRKSLNVTFEHRGSVYNDLMMVLGTFVERPDWISSVAFWYQYPPSRAANRCPPWRNASPLTGCSRRRTSCRAPRPPPSLTKAATASLTFP
ncbi:MAG: glycoside hydrolase family 172 protein [Planctomycetota bacterium]